MEFKRGHYTDADLLGLYDAILLPRMIEEKMLILLRQGKVSKWFSGIGQEAIAVGATMALHTDEYIMPLHRNLGVFTSRQMPLPRLFAQLQGKGSGFSKGRERSFHFGSSEHHIVGMISHLGPQLAIADGIALAHKLDGEGKVSLAFSGDGGTSEGDFHEALNVAAVWELPVIFVIENNGYGLSTPSNEQFRCKQFIDKGIGYGMEAVQIDGNNLLEVHRTVSELAASMRENPRPVLLECITFRMRGHEEASGVKYVPTDLLDHWATKDPVANYETYLMSEGVLSSEIKAQITQKHQQAIDTALQQVFAEAEVVPDLGTEMAAVYAPYEARPNPAPENTGPEKRFIDAISEGLAQAMEQHPGLVLMGQDIADYGGVFKITQGFTERFGKARVRNTPLCESAILGAALGLSIKGRKAMMEMQFADFVTVGFNQIVNNLAKIHYRWGQHADVVVRMPTGAGVGAGPFHSQSNEAWFFHTPGLKIVYPSNPYDAKGLLLTAFEDPNPYLFFEHKALYRSINGPLPEAYYTLPVGKARTVRAGTEATIITYGMGVHWAQQALDEMPEVDVELIDLRTLLPWDEETVLNSVKKTGRAFVLHEDCITGGIGAELAAVISEKCFKYLDAPVMRHGALDTPVPFAISLEKQFLGVERFKIQLKELLRF
ncbi:MAG: thiamine pyrophosphate-dependent enzyme [Bacteroidia bacterium]